MKWRPISELSDEQRDGRWWTFGGFNWTKEEKRNENVSFTAKCINEYRYCKGFCSWINDEGELLDDTTSVPYGDFFLSEPLLDFPKLQKMEWRKFRDEWPEEGQEVFVFGGSADVCVCEGDLLIQRCTFRDRPDEYPRNADCHWMPIIPPEGE